MAHQGLQKQTQSIKLGAGLDRGNDPFITDSPAVLDATNVRFDDKGVLAKRAGLEFLGSLPGETFNGQLNSLHELPNGTLTSWGAAGARAWDMYEETWQQVNECCPRPSRVLTDPIARGNDSLSRSDVAMIGSLACVVWENNTQGTVHYEFVDFSTGKPQILARRQIETLRGSPRVVVVSAKGGTATEFVIIGLDDISSDGGTLYAAHYDTDLATYTFPAPSSLGIVVMPVVNTPCHVWDACSAGTASEEYIVITNVFGANTCRFSRCALTGLIDSEFAVDFRGWACTVNGASGDVVAVGTNADGVWAYIANAPYNLPSAPSVNLLATLENDDDNIKRATVSQLDQTGRMLAAFSGVRDVETNSSVELGLSTDIVKVGAAYNGEDQCLVRSMAIAAKARYTLDVGFADAILPLCENSGESPIVGGGYTATNPATITPAPAGVLVRLTRTAEDELSVATVGRFLQDKIAKKLDAFHLSHTADYGSDLYFTAPVLTDIGPRDGDLRRTQIDLVRANVFAPPPVRSVTAQGLRLAAGGSGLVCMDGNNVAENTPHPVTVAHDGGHDTAYSGTIGPNESLPNPGDAYALYGTNTAYDATYFPSYPLRLCHRWVDASGNIHRSAPSDEFRVTPESATFPAVGWGPKCPSFLIGLSAGEPTAINNDRVQRMDVEVYQAALPDVSSWHLIAICTPRAHPIVPGWLSISALNPIEGPPAVHEFYLQDYSVLDQYPALYTDSEAANLPTPPLLDVCSTQAHLWALSAESRLEVLPSKPLVQGRAPEFYGNTIAVPAEGGECVALAALDDKVVVFKERLVYAIFGSPGDANGENSSLQTPRLISGDVGCSNVLSVVEGPFGVVFQSERGIYAISRGTEFSFVGEAVKDMLVDRTITSGVLVPGQSEVRWTLDDNTALVWNYRIDAWSLWDGFTADHACMWRGRYARLLGDVGQVRVETPGEWTEGHEQSMSVTTAWMKLTGMQGFSRIWRVMLLGRHFSGGITVSIGYDYESEFSESHTFSPTELEALRWSDGKIQLRLHPGRQKSQSIRFRIREIVSSGDGQGGGGYYEPGQGHELVAIDLECGARKGLYKHAPMGARS